MYAKAPLLPRDTIDLVAGRTRAHDEAVDTIEALGDLGFEIVLVPCHGDMAGIMVYGDSAVPAELDERVGRLRWEMREVIKTAAAGVIFRSVEEGLAGRLGY